jgi:hypothetical protein
MGMTRDPGEPGRESAQHPNQPGSDEADKWKQTTPAGVASELEEKAEDVGASTEPDTDDRPPR